MHPRSTPPPGVADPSALSVLLGRGADASQPVEQDTTIIDSASESAAGDPSVGGQDDCDPEGTERASTSIYTGTGPELSPPVPNEELVGGKYQMLDPLGRGGTARVFRVRHAVLGREFALKVLDDPVGAPPQIRRVFQREVQVANKLDHPNIIQLIDYGVDSRLGFFLVMELLRGETLAKRVSRTGPLRSAVVVELSLQVAEALRYLHSQGLVHGDITAENIFLCTVPSEGRNRTVVKLIDFGLARSKASGLRLADTEISGTPQYVAPELLRHYPPQPTMDIYSLGVLIYEMLTGETPFEGTIQEILQAQLHHEPTPPSELLPTPVESRLEELVLDCLDKDPGSRPASMEHVIYRLRTIVKMYGLGECGKQPPPRTSTEASEPAMLHLAGEACPCPMFTGTAQGTIAWMNPACSDLLRTPPAEAIGVRVEDTLLGVILPGVREDVRRCLEPGSNTRIERHFTLGSASGRTAWTVWLYALPDPGPGDIRFAGLLHPSR